MVTACLVSSRAVASPNVSLDDPVYLELEALREAGRLPPFAGGVQPLSESRIHDLLVAAGEHRRDVRAARWTAAAAAARARHARSRAVPRHATALLDPAPVARHRRRHRHRVRASGGSAMRQRCDRDVGGRRIRGYGRAWPRPRWRSARAAHATGLRCRHRSAFYVDAELGPIAAEVGRDVLVLGPSSHTQLGWGENAPPLDHVRLSTVRPLAITDDLRGSLFYAIGRLRDPQTFPGNLVTIARGQLDIAGTIELGMMQEPPARRPRRAAVRPVGLHPRAHHAARLLRERDR